MNAYDAAHQLARSLEESVEYVEYKKAKEKVKQDPQVLKMLKDLRAKQLEVQALTLSGKPNAEAQKSLESLYNIAINNSLIKEFLDAEECFAVLFTDIQNIIVRNIDFTLDSEEK